MNSTTLDSFTSVQSFLNDNVLGNQWISGLDKLASIKIAIAGIVSFYFLASFFGSNIKVKAPWVGYRSFWEPTFVLRLRFVQGALPIVLDGYNKV